MHIWVDADACPVAIKEILYRAAERTRVLLVLVANQRLATPPSPFIRSVRVSAGFDEADRYIAEAVTPGDLVVTTDIPLAAAVVDQGGVALNPRGELYTRDNVREHLATRDMMDDLRGLGLARGGPPPLNVRDRQAFASRLDTLLARHARRPATD